MPLDEAQLQRRLWTPTRNTLQSGLFLNPRERITRVGSKVSAWADELWTFSNAVDATRPTYADSAFGINNPGLSTVGNSELVTTTSFTPLEGVTAFTVFCEFRTTSTGWIWEKGTATPGERAGFVYIAPDILCVINSDAISVALPNPSGRHISCWRYDNARSPKSILRIDGVQIASGMSVTSTGANPAGRMNLGFRVDPTTQTGNLGKFIILPYGASDSLINTIEGYMFWDSNQQLIALPALHPFRNRPPLIGD
jgi:hypothetical protein